MFVAEGNIVLDVIEPVKVGDADNTTLPVPVEVVTPVPPFATGSVPVIPVDNGKPVQLVKVPEVGVPNKGVTNVGLIDKTTLPVPVEVETPVPPLATFKVPPKVMFPVPKPGLSPVEPPLNELTPAPPILNAL